MRNPIKFYIDVVDTCNLICPSCPRGNSREFAQRHGLMTPELLDAILAKAQGELEIADVSLYNWTEPLLHPRLHELIQVVKERGLICGLSSNLNLSRDYDELLRPYPPDYVTISVSGFQQESYSGTHRGGRLEGVKENMRALSIARSHVKTPTNVSVVYHVYRDNLDQLLPMQDFAEALGFRFETSWAYLMPVEKVLGYASNGQAGFQITEQDEAIVSRLAFPLRDALEACRKYVAMPCRLRDQQMTLTADGTVALCCGVFDLRKTALGHYLDIPAPELQNRKSRHSMCRACMGHGIHVLLVYGTPEIHRLATATLVDLWGQGLVSKAPLPRFLNLRNRFLNSLATSGKSVGWVRNANRRFPFVWRAIRGVLGR